ncbi:hypothetical protein SAMN05444320_105103 [Streptoalloteichus hindustanus]|uniref:Uncharacterized protein n=1 Tax=Streptoalloteichus hindustanus TaxID=2017 RepID=A0A1M5ERT9_STRHI|nr:hypothetical protein SAMN05444320_105103 [Streptoalloteichus hindustanus]
MDNIVTPHLPGGQPGSAYHPYQFLQALRLWCSPVANLDEQGDEGVLTVVHTLPELTAHLRRLAIQGKLQVKFRDVLVHSLTEATKAMAAVTDLLEITTKDDDKNSPWDEANLRAREEAFDLLSRAAAGLSRLEDRLQFCCYEDKAHPHGAEEPPLVRDRVSPTSLGPVRHPQGRERQDERRPAGEVGGQGGLGGNSVVATAVTRSLAHTNLGSLNGPGAAQRENNTAPPVINTGTR